MAICLIGNTGLVGRNLLQQVAIDASYDSRAIDAIAGRRFDLLLIAGTPGAKQRANQDPAADAAAIARLTAALDRITARRVVLISTVDVYPHPIDVTESSSFAASGGTAYGRHRLALEEFVAGRFNALVVRLPGLFGPGLTNNAVYDLLRRERLDRINPDSVHQWYPLDRLWLDIQLAMSRKLRLVNLSTEPVGVRDVAREVFGLDLPAGAGAATPVRYDVRSEHARSFGGRNRYLLSRGEVLARLAAFVTREPVTGQSPRRGPRADQAAAP